MGRVIEGLTDPFVSGRSRTVTVDTSLPEAVAGQQHPTLLVEHVSGKTLGTSPSSLKVYEDVARNAIEECFNGATRAVEVRPLGVHVQNVLEETDCVFPR
jgi:hypothetical protein